MLKKHNLTHPKAAKLATLRYLMFKYGIYEYEWYLPICIIYNRVNKFVVEDFNIDNQSDAVAIRDLCESRDSCDDGIFDRAELNLFIDMLCTC